MSGSSDSRYATARIRAKVLANLLLCSPGAPPQERDAVVEWVLSHGPKPWGACEAERNLRMLCLELVGSHRRTGQMSTSHVLGRARELYEFATTIPGEPAEAGPVPRREDRPSALA